MLTRQLFYIVYDVQHGSASYMKTPSGKHIMFDLGTGSIKDSTRTFSPLLHLKNKWGVTQMDKVVITHPHRDHIDDIDNFDEVSPRVLLRPKHLTEAEIRGDNRNSSSEQGKIDTYLEIDARYNSPVAPGTSPTALGNTGGPEFNFFQPTKCKRDNLNNHSLVTIANYLGVKLLIPGDNEDKSWEELLAMPGFRQAVKGTTVMLASHHGRENGFYEPLFEIIKPSLVIISDGPVGTTSVTDKYYGITTDRGANVWVQSAGAFQQRWVVTTRADKAVRIYVGHYEDKPTWYAEID
jgi:competence protein ComEC